MKTTVVFHRADYDGLFCREIARKFLPDAEFIGWDFGDEPLPIPDGQIYILDLPVDRVFGYNLATSEPARFVSHAVEQRIVWIDHHKSSIETHPSTIDGYRIDGVAACRLAWQWFQISSGRHDGDIHANIKGVEVVNFSLPDKQDYVQRKVDEPLAVRLAGEYDIWDHKSSNGADVSFQFGLDAQESINWNLLLNEDCHPEGPAEREAWRIVGDGHAAQRCYAKRDADVMRSRSFLADFEGLKFLCLNTARCNSNTFAARDIPATGHDALMAFYFNGKEFSYSLYHAAHRKDIDLSQIAVKYGGGGHRGACGFRFNEFPF